jgi:hypothetical protein
VIDRLLSERVAVARLDGSFHTLFGYGRLLAQGRAGDDLHHWAVLRTPRVRLERPFDHYVDF